jgi:hypothetical protein
MSQTLEEYVKGLRKEVTEQCLQIGFINLAHAAADSNDADEIAAAAELDMLEIGASPAQAFKGIAAGAMVFQLLALLRKIGLASLTKQPEDYQ